MPLLMAPDMLPSVMPCREVRYAYRMQAIENIGNRLSGSSAILLLRCPVYLQVREFITHNVETDFNGMATNTAILDVALPGYRQVRDTFVFLPAVRA